METLFIAAVTVLLVGYGFIRLRRADAAARRYLESGQDKPLQLAHLSETLARVARETRTLRIWLESPLQAVRDQLATDLTRTDDDVEGFDAVLLDASREVGLWLAMIEGLQPHERQELEALGAGAGAIRGAMEAENGAFERARLKLPGRPTLDVRIEAILRELTRIEAALQAQGHVYR
ncbi:hypothetical protein [Nannocystis bainbridge]|uniref:Secreted protein n=1 Tax=Nannocystis bainbridge TaxID=2995303 RepID=A0ABT5DRW1_9BACT|nr:hypothetical protein [Nannocystis bainbridge]MDC0715910.1 hypothetical protein [Nannocystis bainbridge]